MIFCSTGTEKLRAEHQKTIEQNQIVAEEIAKTEEEEARDRELYRQALFSNNDRLGFLDNPLVDKLEDDLRDRNEDYNKRAFIAEANDFRSNVLANKVAVPGMTIYCTPEEVYNYQKHGIMPTGLHHLFCRW